MHIFVSLSLIKLCRCTHCYVTSTLAIIIQSFLCHLTTMTQVKWQTDKWQLTKFAIIVKLSTIKCRFRF